MASVYDNLYGTVNPYGTPSLSNPTPTQNSFDYSSYFDNLYKNKAPAPDPVPAAQLNLNTGKSVTQPTTTTSPTYQNYSGYNQYQYATPQTAAQLAGQYGAGVVQTNPIGPVAPPAQTALNFGGGTDPLNAGLLSYSKENNTFGTLYDSFIQAQLAQSGANPTYSSGNPTISNDPSLAPVFQPVVGLSPTPTTGTNTTPILQEAVNPTQPVYTTTGYVAPSQSTATNNLVTSPTTTTPTSTTTPTPSVDMMKLLQMILSGQQQQSQGNNMQLLDLLVALGGLGGNAGPRTLNLSGYRTPSQFGQSQYNVARTPGGYTRWQQTY
jgi:hypothetical protein